MRKTFLLFLICALTGCASVTIPSYVLEKHPYQKTVYAPFEDVSKATIKILQDMGWQVSRSTDPAVFELSRATDHPDVRQTLIFTEVRSTPLILGTRYARINVYLRSQEEKTTEIEVRYLTVTSVPFKSFKSYRNDHFVKTFFARVESALQPPS